MTKVFAIALLLGSAALSGAAAEECEFSEPRRAVLEVEDATRLRIDASAGFLRVVGSDDDSQVIVEGTACASRESDLEDIELETRRRGSSLVVEADLPEFDWGWNRYVRLDLTVRVPRTLALDIEDGSGSIEVSGVGDTRIEDGSGEIDIRDVIGNLSISDGSGEIGVRNVKGDLTINDGSGEIDVREVHGRVTVEEDGSGSMTITGIEGDVVIEEDGSGSITIREVTGNVRIYEDGSGSIRAENVGGDFIVDRDGSGGISVEGVKGRVEIPD